MGKTAPRLHGLRSERGKFAGSSLKQLSGRVQDADFRLRRHYVDPFATAQRAAPINAALSLVITLTGMVSSSGCMRPLPTKACMNNGPANLGSILGAMPPPRKTPPVAISLRARLP